MKKMSMLTVVVCLCCAVALSFWPVRSESACNCISPPSGLVGWWPLDDLSSAPSLIGNHTGIFGGTPAPSSIAGEVDHALNFNGSNWVEVLDQSSLNIVTGDFSVDAWVNRSNVSGVRSIIDKRTDGYVRGYHVYIWPGGLLGVQLADGTINPVNHISSLSVPANGWHFVGVSVNRATQTIEFRVDGATQTMSGIGAYSSLANTANLRIGGHSLSPFGHFVGAIDEVEIFNRALTNAEMLGIYNAGSDGKCKQRVALPQTGQMLCFDINGTVTNCASTTQSQDGKIQAGVVWPSQRFAVSGSTVMDNLTGLEWAQDSGTPTFTGNSSTCTGGVMTWQSALDYVACLNLNNYLGHNDWRLPNINELKSPVNVGQSNTLGWLTAQGFTNLQSGNYWSSTSGASATSFYAWGLMFDNVIVDYDAKSSQYYVWPVRGGQFCSADPAYPANISQTGQTTSYDANNTPQTDDGASQWGVPWPTPRFTDNGDNCTVTDDLTGLVWPTDASTPSCTSGGNTLGGQMSSWQDALNYVQCLNSTHYCSQIDWRLPNINELHSLVDHSQFNPALPNPAPFVIGSVHSDHYWSSTAKVGAGLNMTNPNDAWTVDFWGGGVYNNNPASRQPYVLPVRGRSALSSCVPVFAGSNLQQVVTPSPGVSVAFNPVNLCQSGNSCATVASSATTPPANFQILGNLYNISFSGQLCSATGIVVCIDVAGQCSPTAQMFHNLPPWTPLAPYIQPVQNGPNCQYCAYTTSFSEFAVMETIDTTPTQFTFTAQTNVALNAVITSNSITVSGINAAAEISIKGGEYSINGGPFTSASGTVNNDDLVQVRLTSSTSYSTPAIAKLTIGGVSGIFSVTTKNDDVPQPNFFYSCDPITSGKMNLNAAPTRCPTGYTCSYSWSTGETGASTSHTFTTPGAYPVTLTVTASGGGTASVMKSLTTCTVTATPDCGTPVITYRSGRDVSLAVTMPSGSTSTVGLINWGDTSTSPGPSPATHSYTYDGTFAIRWTAQNGTKRLQCGPAYAKITAQSGTKHIVTVNVPAGAAGSYTTVKVLSGTSLGIKSQGSTAQSGSWTSVPLPGVSGYTVTVYKYGKHYDCGAGGNWNPQTKIWKGTVDLTSTDAILNCDIEVP